MKQGLALQGCSIVITRPAHQASSICWQLRQAGAKVLPFPLLAITEPDNILHTQAQLANLAQYHYVIFTSPNAVDCALQQLNGVLPSKVLVAAVGQKTAQCLAKWGVSVSVVPETLFNSEALLATSELRCVKGQSIAIIRGEGGRTLLGDTLQQRGAQVDYISVYRRVCPVNDIEPLLQDNNQIDWVVLTSVESLKNWLRLTNGHPALDKVALLLGSERILQVAKQLGYVGVLQCSEDPSDESVYARLLSLLENK